jgi:hypothetical protein
VVDYREGGMTNLIPLPCGFVKHGVVNCAVIQAKKIPVDVYNKVPTGHYAAILGTESEVSGGTAERVMVAVDDERSILISNFPVTLADQDSVYLLFV